MFHAAAGPSHPTNSPSSLQPQGLPSCRCLCRWTRKRNPAGLPHDVYFPQRVESDVGHPQTAFAAPNTRKLLQRLSDLLTHACLPILTDRRRTRLAGVVKERPTCAESTWRGGSLRLPRRRVPTFPVMDQAVLPADLCPGAVRPASAEPGRVFRGRPSGEQRPDAEPRPTWRSLS
jgi:hypothetical protein